MNQRGTAAAKSAATVATIPTVTRPPPAFRSLPPVLSHLSRLSQILLSRVPVAARQLHHFGAISEVDKVQVVSHLVGLVAAVVLVLQPELAPLVVA